MWRTKQKKTINMDYPEEWNKLPKYERKKKLKQLKREREQKNQFINKVRSWGIVIVVLVIVVAGYMQLTKKSPKQVEFERQIKTASLNGKVQKFPIEGRNHVPAGTNVEYKTNPPTSGAHLSQAKSWGVYNTKIDDKAGVHGLEHGGIWITYKNLDEESIKVLREIGKSNPQSVIVSPRQANDDKVVVASWGKMMKLNSVDKALIQKYINTYKNKSPEKLAR